MLSHNSFLEFWELYPTRKISKTKCEEKWRNRKLYEIKDETILAILDEFEAGDDNNPDLPGFTRKRITAIEPNVEAWIYYYDGKPDESQRILSGKWQ